MKKRFQLLAPFLLSLLVTHPAYAYLATPADADILDEIPLENDLLPEEPVENGGSNDVLLMEILSHVQSIDSNMLNNSTATPSDAGSLDSAENDVDAPGETTYFSYVRIITSMSYALILLWMGLLIYVFSRLSI